MKKSHLLLVGMLLVALTACESDNTSTNSTVNNAATTNNTQEQAKEETKPDVPKEYQSALEKAKMYATTMDMSKAAVYEQLTSEYGEKFSEEAASWAMENLTDIDWKQNALNKAKTYQDDMSMSPAAIKDQLVSEYGEQFTEEEANWAMENLD